MNSEVTYDDFAKLDLRVGEVTKASPVEGSSKLLKLSVSLGGEERTIIGGIGKAYTSEELVGKQIIIIANLEPKELMGETSHGMLLAAHDVEGRPVLLTADTEVPPGSTIK